MYWIKKCQYCVYKLPNELGAYVFLGHLDALRSKNVLVNLVLKKGFACLT